MNLKNQPPVFVPDEFQDELEKLSKAALMDMVWDHAYPVAAHKRREPLDVDTAPGGSGHSRSRRSRVFTLKLYRRHAESGTKMHKVISVHRVVVMEIGKEGHALELWAFTGPSNDYETYYVGKPEEGMEAYGKDDLHLSVDPNSWWGWGLLENWEGNTTEHYRPHDYG